MTQKPVAQAGAALALLLAFSILLGACANATPTPTPPPTLPPTLEPITGDAPVGDLPAPMSSAPSVTADVNVNVRDGPGTQFKVVMTAKPGDSGQVLGISPDGHWYNVPLPEGQTSYNTGWVAKDFVTLSNPGGDTIPTVAPPLIPGVPAMEPPAEGSPAGTTTERGTVRTGPGAEYPIYGLTSTGAQVTVLAKSADGKWWAIKLPTSYTEEGMGWIESAFLKTQNTGEVKAFTVQPVLPDARPTAPGGGQPAAKATEAITVRSGPGTGYKSLVEAKAGDIMAVIGKSEDGKWWVINLPTSLAPDRRGWIPKAETTSSKTDSVPVVATPPT